MNKIAFGVDSTISRNRFEIYALINVFWGMQIYQHANNINKMIMAVKVSKMQPSKNLLFD